MAARFINSPLFAHFDGKTLRLEKGKSGHHREATCLRAEGNG